MVFGLSRQHTAMLLGTLATTALFSVVNGLSQNKEEDLGTRISDYVKEKFEGQEAPVSVSSCDPEKFNAVECEKLKEKAIDASQKIIEMAHKIKG